MIKLKVTPERMEEALSVLELIGVVGGNYATIVRVAPLFVLGEDGQYIAKVKTDADGDIEGYERYPEALGQISKIPAKRMKKLVAEFREAAQNIVNPTNGGDSKQQSASD